MRLIVVKLEGEKSDIRDRERGEGERENLFPNIRETERNGWLVAHRL